MTIFLNSLNVAKGGHSVEHNMASMQNMQQHQPTAKPTWVYPHPSKPFVYGANNGADEVVEVDLQAWKVTRRFPTAAGPYNLDVSPDGKRLVVSYKSAGSTGIWDLDRGRELAQIPNSRKCDTRCGNFTG